jgi:hypothetical protein
VRYAEFTNVARGERIRRLKPSGYRYVLTYCVRASSQNIADAGWSETAHYGLSRDANNDNNAYTDSAGRLQLGLTPSQYVTDSPSASLPTDDAQEDVVSAR